VQGVESFNHLLNVETKSIIMYYHGYK